MKHRTPFIPLAVCCLALALVQTVAGREVKLPAAQPKIATVSAVRVRTAPEVAAEEVTRLRLGAVVNAVERSDEESEIGGKKDYWYHVNLPAGKSGWVFGGLLSDYDPARRTEIFRRIINERLKVEEMSFDDRADLYRFVAGVPPGGSQPDMNAEFELFKLLALARAVMSIPYEERERPPYREFFKAHEPKLVYSEPAGEWMVRSELFWELETRYHASPIAERIAWEAAQNPLPGECEGDEVCGLFYIESTGGEYLARHPNGAHAEEVLKTLAEALASTELESLLRSRGGDRYAVEQRAGLRKSVTKLRATVAKTSSPEKAPVLDRLSRLAALGR